MKEINGRPAIILLVEDDPGDQELTRRALGEAKIRNELYIVEDGEEALDFLNHRGIYEALETSPVPDLILLDLNLPGMDGKELLKNIRKNPDLKRLVVIALTTSREEEDIFSSYEAGVNSYINKPVNPKDFIELVKVLDTYWFQIVLLPPK